ncbi:MAG: hypothetical protein ACFFG0_08830 [Candidatus Thorarchaeota archaeon]
MKIKLRKVKYRKVFIFPSGEPENYEEIEIDCDGTGSQDDPIIIDSLKDKTLNLDFVESDKYIIMQNCTLRFVSFYYSKDISVLDCRISRLHLGNCESIYVKETICSWIEMYASHHCSLIKSRSEESISLYKSHNNIFKNCEFWNFFYDFHFLSRNNILEENDVFDSEDFVFKSIQDSDLGEGNTYSLNCYLKTQGYESCEVQCQGTGKKEDPYIVDTLDSIDYIVKTIEIFNRRDFIIFRNINIKSMKLYDVRYLQLENCNISDSLILKFCSDIKIDSTYSKELKVASCESIDISYSEFNKISVFKGHTSEIHLKSCIYKKIDESLL